MAFLTRFLTIGIFIAFVAGAAHAQQYFPPGVLSENGRSDQFKVDWYSKNLKALGEPSLWELSQTDRTAEVYRFLWLRTFHHPVSVRIVMHAKGRARGRSRLYAKVTTGKAGYDPGRVNRRRYTNLMGGRTQKFVDQIASVGFWTQALHGPEPKLITLDGAEWIVEGIKGGEYHIIDRYAPKPADGDAAYILGTMMTLDLARLHFKKSEIY